MQQRPGKTERLGRMDAARGEALGEGLKRIAGTSLDKGVELGLSSMYWAQEIFVSI